MSDPVVRRAGPDDDLAVLQGVESAGDSLFVDAGIPGVETWLPSSIDELGEALAAGRLWVVDGDAGVPVGFSRLGEVDGCAHLEQLSVHPRAMRRGYGTALLEAAFAAEAAAGRPAVTLTTYRDIPWNGPFYGRRGFVVVDEADWTPGIREIRRHEAEAGFDAVPRVAMRRPL